MKVNGLLHIVRWRALTGTAVSAFLALSAQAQTGPDVSTASPAVSSSTESAPLEDIIVTAQRREQRLIDIPLSISSVSAATIDERQATRLSDLQYTIPGLVLTEFGPGTERVILRGVSNEQGTGATVGSYIDEVSVSAPTGGGIDVRLLDIDRVEVLRGPQPTLYGEGSLGGTIRYITASPSMTTWSGYAETRGGAVADGGGDYNIEGAVGGPIIEDRVALRLAASYEHDDGWIDSPRGADGNGVDATAFRGKLLVTPIEHLTVSLLAQHQHSKQYDGNFSDDDRRINTLVAGSLDSQTDLENLIVSYDFDAFTVLSTTGYLHRAGHSNYDITSFYLPILNGPPETGGFGLPKGYITTVAQGAPATESRWVEEVRLSSKGDGPLTYLFGGYYQDQRDTTLGSIVTAPNSAPIDLYEQNFVDTSKSYVIYGELGYTFFDQLTVTVGARYFHDDRSNNDYLLNFGFTSDDVAEQNFHAFNPRFNIAYRIDTGLIYFNAAKGFRSGGINDQSAGLGRPLPPSYGPEKIWSYEIGTKQDLFEQRLSVALAGFYNDWSNIQSGALVPGSTIQYTDNSGAASGYGVDFTVSGRPTRDLTLSGTVGYTHMRFDRGSTTANRGDPLDLVPDWTASMAVDYVYPMRDGLKLVAHADFGYTGGSEYVLRNFGAIPINPVDSRAVLNARMGLDFGDYQVFVYGDNLTDDYGTIFPAIGVLTQPVRPRPRVVGASLRFTF